METSDWGRGFWALAAIEFKVGLAPENFIDMLPELAYCLPIWHPVAKDERSSSNLAVCPKPSYEGP